MEKKGPGNRGLFSLSAVSPRPRPSDYEPAFLRRGRSDSLDVGGSWAEHSKIGPAAPTTVPGQITAQSRSQSQILPSRDAPSPSRHLSRLLSGRQDLNLRPPGPQPGALPDCATPRGILESTDNPAARGRAIRRSWERAFVHVVPTTATWTPCSTRSPSATSFVQTVIDGAPPTGAGSLARW
jgi:hypothetical protein